MSALALILSAVAVFVSFEVGIVVGSVFQWWWLHRCGLAADPFTFPAATRNPLDTRKGAPDAR